MMRVNNTKFKWGVVDSKSNLVWTTMTREGARYYSKNLGIGKAKIVKLPDVIAAEPKR